MSGVIPIAKADISTIVAWDASTVYDYAEDDESNLQGINICSMKENEKDMRFAQNCHSLPKI